MKGVLEVLVVSAKGVGHTNLIGKTKYFVIVQCGNEFYQTKTSEGNPKEICWNEKFTFELPKPEMENLLYLKIQIMDEELFTDGGLVGETTICLKGVVTEGEHKGQAGVTQTPYNVILEDDTYQGQICIGLKYISNTLVEAERGIHKRDEKDVKVVGPSNYILKTFSNLWKIPWQRIFFFCNKKSKSSGKDMPN